MTKTLNIFQKILVFFAALLIKFYIASRLYLFWSSVHRFFFDGAFKLIPLPKYESLQDAVNRMASFKWKGDGMAELWDAVCTPQKVEGIGFTGYSPHGNDCDEEAIWLANVISNSIPFKDQEFEFNKDLQSASFFTVVWYEVQGKFSGHNVCLLKYSNGYRFMDYKEPSGLFSSIEEVAQLVVNLNAGWDSTGHGTQEAVVVMWSASDKDLHPIELKNIF